MFQKVLFQHGNSIKSWNIYIFNILYIYIPSAPEQVTEKGCPGVWRPRSPHVAGATSATAANHLKSRATMLRSLSALPSVLLDLSESIRHGFVHVTEPVQAGM